MELTAATHADLPQLAALYASFRMPELLFAPWSAAEKQRFVEEQFALQHQHFVRHFAKADFWKIRAVDGGPLVGRLYLDRSRAEWHLIDFGLLPAVRGKGLGSALIAWLQGVAREAGARSLMLQVALNNPRATALYARTGFVNSGVAQATHQPMRWAIRS